MTTQPERVEFLPALTGEPSAERLLYGLAGCTGALEQLTCQGEDDRDLIGNLVTAADCLARLIVHRMGECPVTAGEVTASPAGAGHELATDAPRPPPLLDDPKRQPFRGSRARARGGAANRSRFFPGGEPRGLAQPRATASSSLSWLPS